MVYNEKDSRRLNVYTRSYPCINVYTRIIVVSFSPETQHHAMIQNENTKKCEQCGKTLKGRTDKRFCDDSCRNVYNNQLKLQTSKQVRIINLILQKNRRILESLLSREEDTAKTNREKLLKLGYQFMYHTHLYTTRTGRTYTYCYDYGYLPLDNDWFLIVRKKDE